MCDLRHIFAHLRFGSQCRYKTSARRSMANDSAAGVRAKGERQCRRHDQRDGLSRIISGSAEHRGNFCPSAIE